VTPTVRRSLWELAEASGLRSLVMGASKDPNAKITILLVEAATGRPVLAAKVPTTDAAAQAVKAERRVLLALPAPGAGLANTIPRVVETIDFHGRPGLVTTAVDGVPMSTAYLRWRTTAAIGGVNAHFAAVERWLAGFQDATAGAPARLDMDGGVAARLASRFDGEAQLADDLDRLAEIHGRLEQATVPRTAVHGDLWCGNVLLTEGRTSGVVDWEAGAAEGEPVRDLVRFAHMYALFLDRRTKPGRRVAGHRALRAGDWGAGVRYALEGTGWFPDLFRRFLREGMARLGAPPRLWHDAALAGIAEVAALADDAGFARLHLGLFRSAARRPPAVARAGNEARSVLWTGCRTAARPGGELP
jgi:aminoglycoside phosphotransferase